MTAIEALQACIEAFDKIAEKSAPLEASSGMDWRRKVKIIAAKGAKAAELALAAECNKSFSQLERATAKRKE